MDIIRHSIILLIVLLSCILPVLADGRPHRHHHHHGSSSPDYRDNYDEQHPYYHAAVAGNGIAEEDGDYQDEQEEIPWTWADVLSGRDHPIYGHPVDIEHTVYYTKTVWVDPPGMSFFCNRTMSCKAFHWLTSILAKTTPAARHQNYWHHYLPTRLACFWLCTLHLHTYIISLLCAKQHISRI